MSFRANTVHEAARRGVAGWVRNEPDGSVLLEAQGEASAVGALLEWCKRGPRAASVIAVDVEWIDPTRAETSFRIRF